jgi:predicted RNA binding protein YcfA (HicA-like mRNA interferase family)/predicted RNase H-like HicB family nuclease
MRLTVEFDREADGRWIADVPKLPGVLVYGRSRKEALANAQALAFDVLASDVRHGRREPRTLMQVQFVARAAWMRRWSAAKARRVLAALLRIGWRVTEQEGSHRRLERDGWEPYTFAFHDRQEIGPVMPAKIAKKTGLRPEDV